MTHLYYGEGKGKTTAAVGLALRAHAAGMSVVVVQFLKSRLSGEIRVLKSLPGVTVFAGKSGGFAHSMTEEERAATLLIHGRNFESAAALARAGACQFLLLDELCAAWNHALIDRVRTERFLRNAPGGLELAITGRRPPPLFLELADYATEMLPRRHPFAEKGLPAREGVEY